MQEKVCIFLREGREMVGKIVASLSKRQAQQWIFDQHSNANR
jgi:hypothetical protein